MDIKMDTKTQVDRLIRARYPLIYVVSHEEARVQDALVNIAIAQGKVIYSWTITRGLQRLQGEGLDFDESSCDPLAALQAIVNFPVETPAIFVLKDFDNLLDNFQVVRALRDMVADLLVTRKTAIILSPSLAELRKLEKEVAVIDWPLPSIEELTTILDESVEGMSNSIPVKLNANGDRDEVIRALQGLSAFEARHVLAQAIVATGELSTKAIPYILAEKQQIVRKSGVLEFYEAESTYSDIGGLDLLKSWCKEQEPSFTAKAREFGVEAPRGLLLVGIPGCGKSLTAKAVAGGTRPLLRLDVGALFQGLVGASEANTRAALKVAEATAPCVVWIDEIEKALSGGSGEMDGGTSQRVLGTILTWMQECRVPGLFIVATANDISALRPELVERFDETFFVDLPDEDARTEILRIHLSKRGHFSKGLDLTTVVKATADFSGRVIERVVTGAIRRAFVDGARKVTAADLISIAKETRSLAETMPDKIKVLREWAKNARPASSPSKVRKPAASRKGLDVEIN